MNKNKVNCLIITNSETSDLADQLNSLAQTAVVETIPNDFPEIANQLSQSSFHLLLLPDLEQQQHFQKIKKILRRYNPDTIIVLPGNKASQLKKDATGLELIKWPMHKKGTSHFKNLIRYTLLKKHFRQCKRALRVSEEHNKLLVGLSREPIAHIDQGSHILANQAYHDLFGFQNKAELVSTDFFELVPKEAHRMLRRFFNGPQHSIQKKLILTLQKPTGKKFRAGLRVTTTILNHKKCLQIWVSPLIDEQPGISPPPKKSSAKISTPEKKMQLKDNMTLSPISPSTLLTLPKTRHDIQLQFSECHLPGSFPSSKCFKAKLVIPEKLKTTLSRQFANDKEVFWDEVKLRLLMEKIPTRSKHHIDIFLPVNGGLLESSTLRKWFSQQRRETYSGNNTIHLLIPSSYMIREYNALLHLQESLRMLDVSVNVTNLEASTQSIKQLKQLQPRYISFNESWIKNINATAGGNSKIQQLVNKLRRQDIHVMNHPT